MARPSAFLSPPPDEAKRVKLLLGAVNRSGDGCVCGGGGTDNAGAGTGMAGLGVGTPGGEPGCIAGAGDAAAGGGIGGADGAAPPAPSIQDGSRGLPPLDPPNELDVPI